MVPYAVPILPNLVLGRRDNGWNSWQEVNKPEIRKVLRSRHPHHEATVAEFFPRAHPGEINC